MCTLFRVQHPRNLFRFFVFFPEPETTAPKPKRSLNFTTPRNKTGSQPSAAETEGSFTPLKSPAEPLNGSLLGRISSQASVGSSQKKRQRHSSAGNQSDSDLEYDDDDFNSQGKSNQQGTSSLEVNSLSVFSSPEPKAPGELIV